MKPEVTGRRLDRCDVCGRKVHREDLRYMLVEWGETGGQNYLTHSSYAPGAWSCGATDAGNISIGPREDNSRVKVSVSNTRTEVGGSQTWTGTGTLYYVPGVDCSAWTTLVFGAEIGPYHCPTASTAISIDVGFRGAGGTLYSSATFSEVGRRFCWFTATIAGLNAGLSSSSLFPYIRVTPATGESWWADEMRLEKDVVKPGRFVETSGSARVIAVPGAATPPKRGVGKVCPHCKRHLLNRFDKDVPPVEPDLPPAGEMETF